MRSDNYFRRCAGKSRHRKRELSIPKKKSKPREHQTLKQCKTTRLSTGRLHALQLNHSALSQQTGLKQWHTIVALALRETILPQTVLRSRPLGAEVERIRNIPTSTDVRNPPSGSCTIAAQPQHLLIFSSIAGFALSRAKSGSHREIKSKASVEKKVQTMQNAAVPLPSLADPARQVGKC